MANLIKWKVQPIEKYQRRRWPIAYYKSDSQSMVVQLFCDTPYSKHVVETGNHKEIKIMIAIHHREIQPGYNNLSSDWKTLALRANTLDEAKKIAEDFITKHYDKICPLEITGS